ncbi:GH25 family lysozyme [Limosilactobacillus reuteri]|uniref:GH25 family lysozyme n=1 Tax=Limosilactobacillus reuteri TaxID=1598 RepID=UPI003D76E98D
MASLYTVDVYSGSDDSIIRDPHAQGVIVKATQGTGYVNPKCNHQWDLAGQLGKKRGLYHYAGGGNPVAEAQFFINNIKNYVGQAVLILDWEAYQNSAWCNTNWARQFADEIHRLTGVWPLIYVQESAIWQVANCAKDCGLWVAKYASMNWNSWTLPNMNVSSGAFKVLTGWQFTGGDMDRSVFSLDEAGWDKLANPAGAIKQEIPAPKPQPTHNPALEDQTGWPDALGDRWFEEKGTFISNCALHLRWGATVNSSVIAVVPAGTVIKYDAYSRHGGYVWLRQPREHGQYGYIACRDANTNEAFGTFK